MKLWSGEGDSRLRSSLGSLSRTANTLSPDASACWIFVPSPARLKTGLRNANSRTRKRIKSPLGIVLLIGFSSCEPDDINIGSGDDRDKFVGSWNCAETSESGDQISYTVNIGKSLNSSEVWIEGFASIGFGDTAHGIIAGGDINIYSQIPCPGWLVEGKIIYDDENFLSGNHEVTAGGDAINYTAEYTR